MQTKTKMWIVIIAGSLIAGCATYYYVVSSSLSSSCSFAVLAEVPSADGRYIATAFERNCGATSPYVRIVSIRSGGTRLRPEDGGSYVFVTQDQPNLAVTWSGPLQLTVVTDGYSHTPIEQRLKSAHWKDIGIVMGPS